jgi:hypothetical protein
MATQRSINARDTSTQSEKFTLLIKKGEKSNQFYRVYMDKTFSKEKTEYKETIVIVDIKDN